MSKWAACVADRDFYAALLTEPATAEQTGETISEPVGEGYARRRVRFGPSGSMVGSKLSWTNMSAEDWSIVGVALCDAKDGGAVVDCDNSVPPDKVTPGGVYELTNIELTEPVDGTL